MEVELSAIGFRRAKVYYEEVVSGVDKVVGLDVAVHDAGIVDLLDKNEHLPR